MHGTASQHIDHTTSRRSGPRKWLQAVTWLISAGLHPKANHTTLRITEDLAARMDYDTGHVRYCLDEMAARLGISRASIKRHVGYLRELGALAWVQHGTRVNIRRAMGLKGYAATATIYAAVIPAAYDHAMGHTIIGAGYQARIVIDQRDQQTPVIPAQTRSEPVDNPPVENPGLEGLEPPSLTWLREESQVQVVEGYNYTSQARQPKPRIPHQSTSINGRRRTAADVQKAGNTTRLVRAMVNWTQAAPLRQLEFVLRAWTDRGKDAYEISADLNGWCHGMRWKPTNPVAFIKASLAAVQEQQQEAQAVQAAADRYELENPAQGAFQARISTRIDVMAANRQGLARYQKQCQARGLDDLSTGAVDTWDAEADILAFLNGSPA
ncbi:cell wall protein [Streptomyces sp. WAC 04229]|uniref:cell wall protein n=1 Tax=Streptomyces sp. WAC 04229 TaxID=2203206 RepID=UPI000F746030|nr:cell wall protein [Streptomyces sp. WAC 04229]RSN55578.1 cell wall protein [Streptomyces sp. WAC 04229]